jgi:hypothetical protein
MPAQLTGDESPVIINRVKFEFISVCRQAGFVVGGDSFDGSTAITQDKFAQYKSAQNDGVIFWFSVSDLVVNRGRKGGFELTAMRQLAITKQNKP